MLEESWLKRNIPILSWLPKYDRSWLTVDMIEKTVKELRGQGIDVYMTDVHVPVRECAAKVGLLELIGEDHVFPTIDSAVHHIETIKKENK